jgi:hypothetical protein
MSKRLLEVRENGLCLVPGYDISSLELDTNRKGIRGERSQTLHGPSRMEF